VILLSPATSVKGVLTGIVTNVNKAIQRDMLMGRDLILKLLDIYSTQAFYLVDGMTRAMSYAAGMISEVQIIVTAKIKQAVPVTANDILRMRSLWVSIYRNCNHLYCKHYRLR
jgi:hypothetical protein